MCDAETGLGLCRFRALRTVFGTAGSVLAQNVGDGGSAGAISLIALPLNDAIDIRLDGRIDEAAWS